MRPAPIVPSVLLVLGTGVAAAEPVALDVTVDVSTVSDYVWRGDRMAPGVMVPVAQSYVELGLAPIRHGRLAVGAWTSAFLTGRAPSYEVDPYVSYAAPWGPATITTGYAVYLVTDAMPVTTMHEASLQVALEDHALVPSAGVAVDFVRTDGWYAWAALAHQRTLGPATVATRVELGGSDYAGLDAGFQHATLSSRGSVEVGAGVYLAASGALAYAGRSAQWTPTLAVSVGVSR